jgi:isopentenyl diphosphate isomerase/L-lactate dehydrogenase-like FMN-dependent dehydrogenase
MAALDRCYNIADLRAAAKSRLPKGVFDYVDKGTEDQVALANNTDAFHRVKLRNKVLVDLTGRRLDSTLFGKPTSLPMAIAPTGIAGLCWYQGELELAKAAAKFGLPFTLATGSSTSIETIADQAGGRLWFQLYMWDDRSLSYELVKRVRAAKFEALVVTVDTGLGANREHNKRNGFNLPFKLNARATRDVLMHPRWLATVLMRYLATGGMPKHENYPAGYQHRVTAGAGLKKSFRAESLTWTDIDRLRDLWPGTLIVKGILRADDAALAVEHGADGVVVSNHGGRNMDSAVAPLDVLPEIVRAVGDRTTVIVDSGVRRGSALVKALALGADAVLTGRATLYGTAAGGQQGAEHALGILRMEFEKTMAYVGCLSVEEVTGDVLAQPPAGGTPAAAVRRLAAAGE